MGLACQMTCLSCFLRVALVILPFVAAAKKFTKVNSAGSRALVDSRGLWICKPEIQDFILAHAGTTGYLVQECLKAYPEEACASAQRSLGDGPDLFTRLRVLCSDFRNNMTGYDPLSNLPPEIRDQLAAANHSGHTINIGVGGITVNGQSPWGHIPGPGEIVRDIRSGFGGGHGGGGGGGGGGGDGGGGGAPGLYPPGVHVPGPNVGSGGVGGHFRVGGDFAAPATNVGSGIDVIVDSTFGAVKGLFDRADPTANNGDSRNGRRITGPAVPTDQVPYLDASLRKKSPVGAPFDWEHSTNEDGSRLSEAADAVRVYGAEQGDHQDHVEGLRVDEQDRPAGIASAPPTIGSISNNSGVPMSPPPISRGTQDSMPPPLEVVANTANALAGNVSNATAATGELAAAVAAALANQIAQQQQTTVAAIATTAAPAEAIAVTTAAVAASVASTTPTAAPASLPTFLFSPPKAAEADPQALDSLRRQPGSTLVALRGSPAAAIVAMATPTVQDPSSVTTMH